MTASALVVGAGVFGLSTARALASRGWRVRVVDEHGPGRAGPSSAESRVLRFSHGTDEWYAASAARAVRGWHDLAGETGRCLFVDRGVLLMVPAGGSGEWERESHDVLRRLGIPVELVDRHELARRHPMVDGLDFAVYEPTAGVLRARDAVLALAESATAAGVELSRGTAAPGRDLVLLDGCPTTADLIIWAPGPRLPALFPGLTSARRVRQDSFFLAVPASAVPAPAWLDTSRGMYGVPAPHGAGVKVVPDVELEPDAVAHGEAEVCAYLRERFPRLGGLRPVRREACFYAAMPDDHFLLDRHPDMARTWLVGGDSGHGFKHGPAWGEYVADVVEGRTAVSGRFALR